MVFYSSHHDWRGRSISHQYLSPPALTAIACSPTVGVPLLGQHSLASFADAGSDLCPPPRGPTAAHQHLCPNQHGGCYTPLLSLSEKWVSNPDSFVGCCWLSLAVMTHIR